MRKFLIFIFFSTILRSEIIRLDIYKDTFISKDKPEISLKDATSGGVRSWWSYYLFKIDTESLREKIKDKRIKDAYFNFYIWWFEILPKGFAPFETKTDILFYPILTEWKDDCTYLYPSLENREIKWDGMKRGKDYSENPIVIYRIENENEIKGKKRIGGFGEVLKLWISGELKNNGILMMVRQAEKETPYLIQINIDTSKTKNKERMPFFEVDLE